MGKLQNSYEISLWTDVQNGTQFTETRVAIIGSSSMTALCRALSPKFKKSINGAKELTFKMHRQYVDSITGELTVNPFVELINNESKIKLKYKNKWYDFIVKNIQQDSSNSTYTYTATDLHVNELSKNGYNLVLDTSLMNNTGELKELGEAVLAGTGWTVEVDAKADLTQYLTEQLVELEDSNGKVVYAFYSSCTNKPYHFQYVAAGNLGNQNEDGIYDKPDRSVIKNMTESSYKEVSGLYIPIGYTFKGFTEYRANSVVYTHKSKFNPELNRVVYSYNEGAIEGYSTTEYITPNLIQNLVSNSQFKSTSGWTGAYMTNDTNKDNSGTTYNATVEVDAIRTNNNVTSSLIEDLLNGNWNEKSVYSPCLRVTFPRAESVLVNSGFYDNRTIIKNLSNDQEFVLMYKETSGNPFTVRIGDPAFSVSSGHYPNFNQDSYLVFETEKALTLDGYKYVTAKVSNYREVSEKEYQLKKMQIFITGEEGKTYQFFDFQIFPCIKDAEGNLVTPTTQSAEAQAVTKYYYYNAKSSEGYSPSAIGYRATEQEYVYTKISNTPAYTPDYTVQKINSINIKQSNYFNAIQTLCETFEVWADLEVDHDFNGVIGNRKVVFKSNIENPNYVGFRYGVNLKQSKRTIDSKAIVTKLIVPDNTNEFAPNGFCSIARASANPTGEDCIYDFSYYYNFGLLDYAKTCDMLYGSNENLGYYVKLRGINKQLNDVIDRYSALAAPFMQAEADKQIAESGKIASEEQYKEAADDFFRAAGYAHTDINTNDEEANKRKNQIENSPTLKSYFTKIAEYYSAWKKYAADEAEASELYKKYKDQNDALLEQINEHTEAKNELNKAFYTVFSRFIQEGTWKDDNCTDNERYYCDAVAVSSNSSVPKVSYTFSVLDLSQIDGYEHFTFDLADQTWVEDPELFGNHREIVVITEVTYALDEPDQNSIKVQNYRNQFADLFQKITATTQQVQYAAGSWGKAADFAEANPVKQAAFLQNALADAEMKLQNAGEQSVVWDKTGITVTDLSSPNQQLRIIGGAILLRDQDEDGLGWKVGITSAGISAKLLTSGRVDTGVVQIMNGNEPCFRWDAFGITAYSFESKNDGGYITNLDTSRGVRFDRFGIYGYDDRNIDGATWHPQKIGDVLDDSLFALTWDGLFIKLGKGNYNAIGLEGDREVSYGTKSHGTSAKIGKVSDRIYNTWGEFGPTYVEGSKNPDFVKVFAVGDTADSFDGNEELVIYDDGTLVANSVKLTGSIEWTDASSPSKSVYCTAAFIKGGGQVPPPKTKPSAYEKVDPTNWHTECDTENDSYYAHTDNGGATWQGPFLITGKSIAYQKIEYAAALEGTKPEDIPESAWGTTRPALTSLGIGQVVYVRIADIFNNGDSSDYRYSIDGGRPLWIELSQYSTSIPAGSNGEVDSGLLKDLSTVEVRVSDGSIDITNELNFDWQTNDTENRLVKIDNTTVYLSAMTNRVVTITVIAKKKNTSELLGVRTFTISKSLQGERGAQGEDGRSIQSYISSSAGTAFEEKETGSTTLTAYVLENGQNIANSSWSYVWYFEGNNTSIGSGLSISVNKSELAGKRVYFIADDNKQ